MKKIIGFLLFVLSLNISVNAQGFIKPTEGKAAIYFTRSSKYGSSVVAPYFHNKEYIGEFKFRNYLVYECDPGKHVFWTIIENTSWIEVEVEANKVYIVNTFITPGVMKPRVGLDPLTIEAHNIYPAIKEIINTVPPIKMTEKQMDKQSKRFAKAIKKKWAGYEKNIQGKGTARQITTDMYIPESEF